MYEIRESDVESIINLKRCEGGFEFCLSSYPKAPFRMLNAGFNENVGDSGEELNSIIYDVEMTNPDQDSMLDDESFHKELTLFLQSFTSLVMAHAVECVKEGVDLNTIA